MWVVVCTLKLLTATTSCWGEAHWATGSGKLTLVHSVREELCTFHVRSGVITILSATACWQPLGDSSWIKIKDGHAILSEKYYTNITTTHWSTWTCDLAAILSEEALKLYWQYCFLFYSEIFVLQSMYENQFWLFDWVNLGLTNMMNCHLVTLCNGLSHTSIYHIQVNLTFLTINEIWHWKFILNCWYKQSKNRKN